jgi:hypothetical protein
MRLCGFCEVKTINVNIRMELSSFVQNINRKKTELNVVLNESLNTINKGNGNKVSSVGIIVFHVVAA